MGIEINNDLIHITKDTITEDIKKKLIKLTSYKDKGILYRLKRMANNSFLKNSQQYKDLKAKVDNCVLIENSDGSVSLPSGLLYILDELGLKIDKDNRHDTGLKLSFPWKTKPYDLRDYQDEGVDLIEVNWRSLLCYATGLGKTLIAIHAIRRVGRKTLIVVPTKSIAKQFHEELCLAFGENRVGFYGDGKKQIRDITVGIAASVANHIEDFKKAELGLVTYDECHHTSANTFYEIGIGLANVGKIIGLTATAFRSDGKDLLIHAIIGKTILDRDVIWGVKNGWLAKPYFLIRRVNTDNKRDFKDKLKSYKEHVLNNKEFKDLVKNDILNMLIAGKSVLVLVAEVEHGEELSKELNLPFAQGSDKQSSEYVDALNEGKIRGLIGTRSFIGEGTNTKKVDCLILACFIAGRGPVLQSIGRGLRKQGTKEHCIILDYILTGSEILSRHSYDRIEMYNEICTDVKIVEAEINKKIPEWLRESK